MVDWCAVDLLDEDGDRRPVAVAHADPDRLALAEQLRNYEPAQLDPERGLGLVLRTGQPVLMREIGDEMLQSGSPPTSTTWSCCARSACARRWSSRC